jgi:hypothetical protein
LFRVLLFLMLCAPTLIWQSAHAAGFDESAIKTYVAAKPRPMTVKSTAQVKSNMLQLAIKWYGLPKGEGTGGALVVADNILIVIRPRGDVFWADLKGSNGFYRSNAVVPMNLAEYEASGIPKNPEMDPCCIRVGGAHGEPTENGFRLFVSHHRFEDGCFYFQVSAIDLVFRPTSGLRSKSEWQTIFKPTPCVHIGDASGGPFAGHQSGGRIVRFDDRYLLVSYGDHEMDGESGGPIAPQERASPYGKIWKVAKDGSSSSLYALGLRNPQGLLAARDGRIWESEHGPQGGDELNLIVEGANYGWPFQTFGVGYEDYVWPPNPVQGDHSDPRYRQPQFGWVPAIAPSNLTQVTGSRFPLWQSDLLLGTLNGESIHRLRIVDDRVIVDEPIKIGQRLRDIAFLADGRFALLADKPLVGIVDNAGVPLNGSAAPESDFNILAK